MCCLMPPSFVFEMAPIVYGCHFHHILPANTHKRSVYPSHVLRVEVLEDEFRPFASTQECPTDSHRPALLRFSCLWVGHILPRPLQAARRVRLQHLTVLSGFVDDKSEPMTDHRFVIIRFEPFGQRVGISDCNPNVFLGVGVVNFVANCDCGGFKELKNK